MDLAALALHHSQAIATLSTMVGDGMPQDFAHWPRAKNGTYSVNPDASKSYWRRNTMQHWPKPKRKGSYQFAIRPEHEGRSEIILHLGPKISKLQREAELKRREAEKQSEALDEPAPSKVM